jgi:fatty acid kinase fatty acid binding subunit
MILTQISIRLVVVQEAKIIFFLWVVFFGLTITKGGIEMKIVTDCAADLSKREIEELEITVAPLFIQFPNGEVNAIDITPDEFYERLKSMAPKIPTTAQPSAGIFTNIYKGLTETGEDVVSVHISGGLSGTIESARLGATQLPGKSVEIVDSLTLSGGERFQVLAAAMAAKAGWQKEKILEKLSKIRAANEVIYTLETLEYLQRGGRIGRVQALAGSLLHLKPIICVEKSDGKYSTVGKVRTIPKALDAIIDYIIKIYGSETPLWVTVLHGQMEDQAKNLAALAQEKLNMKKLEIMRISPVLGVHTGPGIVGIAAVPIQLMEGLV